MPTWGEILKEVHQTKTPNGNVDLDTVRRKYLIALHKHTGRNVILYATKWSQSGGQKDPEIVSINDEDTHGLMEVVHGLPDKPLDLILHSPGGSAEAAEMLVSYLRSKFPHIRVIVPQAAMSAATMLACAADEIVMGKHSALGPIDPQFILPGPYGPRFAPAQAILDQFEMARQECQKPQLLGAWAPMLAQYGPALLKQCENALQLSQELVSEWMQKWMFKGETDAVGKANTIAAKLRDHGAFKSHGRHIDRDKAESMGLKIVHLEKDQKLQDLVLSVFHAVAHTFTMSIGLKIIENHLGKAFVKLQQQQQTIQFPMPLPVPPAPGPKP